MYKLHWKELMIAEDQNKALLVIGESALKNHDWVDYANYCFKREKGLRKEAFEFLGAFLLSTETWTFEAKKDFVKFLFPFFDTVEEADYGPFPQPLRDNLIQPTLLAWCMSEKSNADPFRWYGKYYRSEEHLFKALHIDTKDDLARQTILKWTDGIYNSVHHLPEYYIGDPFEDRQLGEKIKDQIQLLSTDELKSYWSGQVEEDLELLNNYIDWQLSGHPDFEKWGLENKKQTGYLFNTTYYYDK